MEFNMGATFDGDQDCEYDEVEYDECDSGEEEYSEEETDDEEQLAAYLLQMKMARAQLAGLSAEEDSGRSTLYSNADQFGGMSSPIELGGPSGHTPFGSGHDFDAGAYNVEEISSGSNDYGGAVVAYGGGEEDYSDEEEEEESFGYESPDLGDGGGGSFEDRVNAIAELQAAHAKGDLPAGFDLQMLEAMLAQVQNGAVPNQMYDELHGDDDDDDDYDDDEEDDDEEDYYPSAGGGGGDQHSIGMFQNPFGSGGAGGGGAAGEEEGMQGLLQGLLNMSGAAGLAEMGGGMANMVSGMMGGSPMDGGGAGPGGFDTSMIPGLLGTLGAAAANGIVDGFNGGGGNGATLREYDEDEDDDDDEEEITEASESEDEDEEESDEDEEEHHHNGAHMAAMAAMGGMAGGAGVAAMAAMMNQQSHMQQHPSQQQMHMYEQHNGRQMMQQHGSPYMMSAAAAHQAMYAPSPSTAPLSLPSGASQPPHSSASSSMPGFAAVAVASAAAAAAAAMSLPSSSPAPVASVAAPAVPSSAVMSPPVSTISSGMGGGTMSRVDPLAALVAGGTATAMGGVVMGKMVSTLSNNSGGGTALVKTEHMYAAAPGYATLPPSTMHKSLDELNKLSDGMARMSSMPMQSPHSQAMHAAMSHQHLAQIHHAGQPGMMYPKQFMAHPMMLRPPVSRSSQMMPHHGTTMPDGSVANGNRNDGDKTSLDRESVPCSETSGGGKSDTESTTKKTPSPTMVGPGRVSPDSSSESSSSRSSDRGHVKNATSMGSLSDLQSATESMRDSDTDNQLERHQMQMRRRLCAMEHDPLAAGNAIMSGPVPLLIETPNYGWSSLVGHENAKDALKNLFLGKKFPEVFDSQGSCRGVLLFGPSGAGKTSLARSLACEAGGAKLIACTPSLISNRNFHPTAAATLVRQMFDHARVYKPCVMLMDEIERLALPELTEAEKAAKAELMAQVRGETTIQPAYPPNANPKSINDHVMLVATTCSPWMLPEELRRLFAYNIHIKLPGEKQREELFRMFLNNYANNVTADHYKCLLSKSEGYSAADINTVVRQAASYIPQGQPGGPNQLHQNHPRVVTYDDLASAMTNYRCSCKPEDLAYYMKYIQEATHRTEDIREDEDKKKPKGVKKIGRLAKSFAAAVISVID